MPKITDTYALAYACCEQVLIETGKFPTIDAIKTRIGVNSPNTINHAIKAWTQDFAEKQLEKRNRPDLPTCLLDSIEQIWKQATKEAEKNYLNKEKAFHATIGDLQQTISEQQATLTQDKQRIESLTSQNQQLTHSVDALEMLSTELEQKNKINLERIQDLEKQSVAKEKQLAEQEAQWQVRQEQDQLWFARRLQEEKTFIEQVWRDKYQRQQETIQSLTLSEDSLRQTCLSLNTELKKVTEELKMLQKAADKKYKVVRNKRFSKTS